MQEQPDATVEIPSLETSERELRGQSIIQTLARLHGGRLLDQVQVELKGLVKEVIENRSGKGGKLVLELVVEKPAAKTHLTGNEIIIEASIKVKLPDDPPDAAIFYHDKEGGLHNADPYQRPMFDRTK